jgi:PBP1b-binding outer membrane lipoprotein LpoB
MKKVIILAVALTIVLLINACSGNAGGNNVPGETVEPTNPLESIPPAEEPNEQTVPADPTERLSFEGGNIGAHGLVCPSRRNSLT